ncbi:MAG: peptidylprolyl isomerase [Chloroflexota bacterium]|nr:peptidylprolyl isomerase [Chloroflexota bacterium]
MRRILLLAALIGLAACASPTPAPRPACPTKGPTTVDALATLAKAGRAVVDTNKGSFTIELYGEKAPLATASFVALARCGFYDGISFHRILPGFVAQAGDPQTRGNRGDFEGLGSGGPGYGFEIEPPASGLNYDPYVVAMANDKRANGSQFFIDLADLNGPLKRLYTIFGKVIDGTDVVDTIGKVPTNGPRGLPLDPVIINSIRIEAKPAPSPSV